jgi:hypothetical protein
MWMFLVCDASSCGLHFFFVVANGISPLSSIELRCANAGDRRLVSPHVTIYAFPMAAISSITNRVTGITLSLGLPVLSR